MTQNSHYAAVAELRLNRDPLPDGSVSGLAVPAKGSKPCGVALVAGGNVVAIAGAIEFSSHAAQIGARHGWCSFTIGGFGQAATMADHVELRCLASDRTLAWWDSAVLASGLEAPRRTPIRLEQLLGRVRKLRASSDMEQILPFGLHFAQSRGTGPFLQASWQYYLNRDINSEEVEEWGDLDYTEADTVRNMWSAIMGSPECEMGKFYSRPGPFDPAFPFTLGAFG